ncbi:sensor domain-containing diguanylate cyclase [Marinobacterium mangrovicola]|uniref:diguanylate cyclase n=1 Tax=Marinobacterium mangrovicola TaxID=1476959 RepID=A0A4R1GBR4_9GAMM|nr:diguanylate cyclase [Marinobacterium mangrovicola]TCK05657.1 diguanylate cyclase (GGDEF)-like protein [Marinobacterium mangrovicola]
MKLVRQVLLTAILPLAAVLLAGVWLLISSVDKQEEQIQQEDELLQQIVRARVVTLLSRVDAASKILALNREAVLAVQDHNVNTLYELGRQYEPLQLSRIIYLDLQGRVLSRSDDRYRFGDDLSEQDEISQLLVDGVQAGDRVAGLFQQEDGFYYLIARPVLQYQEIPIGIVVSQVKVTPERLKQLVLGTGADIEIQIGGQRFSSFDETEGTRPETVRRVVPMGFGGRSAGLVVEEAQILLWPDRGIHSVDSLARQLLILFAVLLILLPILLMWILRRYLRPYAELVDELQQLSVGSVDLGVIRKTLGHDFRDAPEEVSRVAQAISGMAQTLERQMDELEHLAVTDQLTGLKNRRFLTASMQHAMARIYRHGGELSVLLIDLDQFKRINDRLGHSKGDEHLCSVAEAFRDNCRSSDIIARWGGEEFMLLCPDLDLKGASDLAEKLRKLVDGLRSDEVKAIDPLGSVGTLSIGAAQWLPGETAEQLLQRVDRALYRAKEGGRNRVEICAQARIAADLGGDH